MTSGDSSTGFFVSIPNPLFGPMLQEIDTLGELKCTLRILWHLHRKRGSIEYVTLDELIDDEVLSKSLGPGRDNRDSRLRKALASAVNRGTFLTHSLVVNGSKKHVFLLNKKFWESDTDVWMNRNQRDGSTKDSDVIGSTSPDKPNIFAIYEDNIGVLNPMIVEALKEAESEYPLTWIIEAIREAVTSNRRSWRAVVYILDRWQREGKNNGGVRRSTQKTGYQDYFRR